MKNKILAIIRDTIPYCKDLRPIAGSVTACILMQQLDYWFAKKPNGFYKFKAPCPHPLYKEGDSWKEELGFSEDEIQTAFSKIGIAYKSKTSMMEAEYPFKDEKGTELFYCSFYDRESRLTWYQRNHEYADNQLDKLTSFQKPTIPDSEKRGIPDSFIYREYINKDHNIQAELGSGAKLLRKAKLFGAFGIFSFGKKD